MIKLLESTEEWYELKESTSPLIIFKHSRTCPISIHARERIAAVVYLLPTNIYEVVVQDSQELSDIIAKELGLEHQSPQIIVLVNGKAFYHRDHEEIRGDELLDFVKNLEGKR